MEECLESNDGGHGYAALMVAMGTLDALVKARSLPKEERGRIIAVSLALLQACGPSHAPARETIERFRRIWRAQERRAQKLH